jgi:hypothetical protein
MRLENIGSHFEMALVNEEDTSVHSGGDAYITLDVLSNGFAGRNDLCVLGQDFSAFCTSLISLERSLKGEALLDSISPNELKLRIYSANNRGIMAIEGNMGYEVQGRDGAFWHSVSFGFTFEPQQLTKALALPWLRE